MESIVSATKSEINTFKVLANLEFSNLGKKEPNRENLGATPEVWGGDEEDFKEPEQKEEEGKPIAEPIEAPIFDRERSNSTRSVKSIVTVPEPPKHEFNEKAREESAIDVAIEKEALLYELELMEKQGSIKLHRQLTMADSLDSIQYQYDRANMIVSTQQTVDWAKTGIKMGSGVLETVLKKFGLGIVDGFSNNLCKDMSKFNQPLTKMYRKYWRRGTSSPEMELAMIVFGALAMTVLGNRGMMGQKSEKTEVKVPSFTEPSILKGPTLGAEKKDPVIPEWAKAAMAQPVDRPMHFAKRPVEDTYPELNSGPPQPIRPVVRGEPVKEELKLEPESKSEPVRSELVRSETLRPDETGIRKLTLQSPKSSRRKREPVTELNLDD